MKKIFSLWLMLYSMGCFAAGADVKAQQAPGSTSISIADSHMPIAVLQQNKPGDKTIYIVSQNGSTRTQHYSFTQNPNGTYTVKDTVTSKIISQNLPTIKVQNFLKQIPTIANGSQQPRFLVSHSTSTSDSKIKITKINITGSTSGASNASNGTFPSSVQVTTTGSQTTCTVVCPGTYPSPGCRCI